LFSVPAPSSRALIILFNIKHPPFSFIIAKSFMSSRKSVFAGSFLFSCQVKYQIRIIFEEHDL
jgi:hypothetical protein